MNILDIKIFFGRNLIKANQTKNYEIVNLTIDSMNELKIAVYKKISRKLKSK